MAMRVASWNVNSLRVRLPHVLDWLAVQKPDVLGLQETKLTDDAFPLDELKAAGYEAVFSGQKTYNGVALLSRRPPTDVIRDLDGLEDHQRRVLGATVGGVRILNLYVPNGQAVGTDKYAYKLDWLSCLRRHLEGELAAHERVVVMGDFNIAPEDRDVHDPEEWRAQLVPLTGWEDWTQEMAAGVADIQWLDGEVSSDEVTTVMEFMRGLSPQLAEQFRSQ